MESMASKLTSYWLLNKLVPFGSLQEYHKGILNMHMNLLLMQYESVRLLTVCMRLLKYNNFFFLKSLQQ